MAFELPALPYAANALEPYISANTLNFHHGKHHAAYVANLNKLIEGGPLASKALVDIIGKAAGDADKVGIFNNAAQTWNHTFFWNSLSPKSGAPSAALAERIDAAFGSLAAFKEQFKQAAVSQFGSGWAWLIEDNGKLAIMKTGNADLPLAHGKKALFTVDVWEHAYYLDYQNRRPDFVQTVLDRLVNWDFIAANLKA